MFLLSTLGHQRQQQNNVRLARTLPTQLCLTRVDCTDALGCSLGGLVEGLALCAGLFCPVADGTGKDMPLIWMAAVSESGFQNILSSDSYYIMLTFTIPSDWDIPLFLLLQFGECLMK